MIDTLKELQDKWGLGRPSTTPPIIVPASMLNGTSKATFKVMLGICTHRDVKLQVFNLLRSVEKCPNPEIKVATAIGDALIDRSRAKLATLFVKSDFDQLWFIDDDIIIDTLDLTRMMWQMKKDDLDILGAPYCIKSETDRKFAVRPLEDKIDFPVGKGAPIQQVRFVSTGCMGIQKRVFQKMIDKEIYHLCHAETDGFYPFFTPGEMCLNGKWIYCSEDWNFCRKADELGFKVYCDFSVKIGHIGPKVFDWDDFFVEDKKIKEGFMYNIDIQRE